MNKIWQKIMCALLLSSSLAQAFEGTPTFETKKAGVVHNLKLSHWKVDATGLPTFDYVYEQRAGECQFRMAGRAEGLVEEVNGKMTLVVINEQDEKGREMPPAVTYAGEGLTLILPAKGALREVWLRSSMRRSSLRERACDKGNDEGLTVRFRG